MIALWADIVIRSGKSVEMCMAICLNIAPEYRTQRQFMIPVFIASGKGKLDGAVAMVAALFHNADAVVVNVVGDLPAMTAVAGRVGHSGAKSCFICTQESKFSNEYHCHSFTESDTDKDLLTESQLADWLLQTNENGGEVPAEAHFKAPSLFQLLPYCSAALMLGTIDFMHTAFSCTVKYAVEIVETRADDAIPEGTLTNT